VSKSSAEKVLIIGRNELLSAPDIVYDRLVRILIRSVLGEKYASVETVDRPRVVERTLMTAGRSK